MQKSHRRPMIANPEGAVAKINRMNHSAHFIALWQEGRTGFSKLLSAIKEDDLKKTLAPAPNFKIQ